jgi:hypothetical protein
MGRIFRASSSPPLDVYGPRAIIQSRYPYLAVMLLVSEHGTRHKKYDLVQ